MEQEGSLPPRMNGDQLSPTATISNYLRLEGSEKHPKYRNQPSRSRSTQESMKKGRKATNFFF